MMQLNCSKEYPYADRDNFAFGYNSENYEKTLKSIDIIK